MYLFTAHLIGFAGMGDVVGELSTLGFDVKRPTQAFLSFIPWSKIFYLVWLYAHTRTTYIAKHCQFIIALTHYIASDLLLL